MKKMITIALCVCLIGTTFAGCGKDKENVTPDVTPDISSPEPEDNEAKSKNDKKSNEREMYLPSESHKDKNTLKQSNEEQESYDEENLPDGFEEGLL